jgi:DNA polymerase-3 subunit delta'
VTLIDDSADLPDPWTDVIGQDIATARLDAAASAPVHAYLFLGSPGSGTYRGALGFAALLLSNDAIAAGDRVAATRHRRLALAASHPDVVVIEAEGAFLTVPDAEEIIRQASTSPVEGRRKVIVIPSIELINEATIGKVLKIIEEPPETAVFVLLAQEVPPEIVTIASRCVSIDFAPISTQVIETALFAAGVPPKRAKAAAAAANGDIERARLLATDDALADRAALWRSIPDRLDGSGSIVVELVNQVREAMDAAQEPLESQHLEQLDALEARVELTGERGSGRSTLVAKHKRELRKLRVDELRFGLATLSRRYRDQLLERADDEAEASLRAIQRTVEALRRNPNEALLLQSLLLDLHPVASVRA